MSLEEVLARNRDQERVLAFLDDMEDVETEAQAEALAARMRSSLGEEHPDLQGLLDTLASHVARVKRQARR